MVSAQRGTPKTWLRLALAVWALLTLLVFGLSFVIEDWPSWLQLPWSGVADFVEAADGSIHVYVAMYGSVAKYDASGHFLASFPLGRGSGGKCLSAGEDGRLYKLSVNTLCVYTPEWVELECETRGREASRAWRLGADGEIEHLPEGPGDERVPNRLVRPGELLFAGCPNPRRKIFYRQDGGWIRRQFGPSLEIRDPSGNDIRFGTPWYLLWVQIPFPAVLPWLILGVWNALETRGARKAREKRRNAAPDEF